MIRQVLSWIGGGSSIMPWAIGAVLLLVTSLAGWARVEQVQRRAAEAAAETAQQERDAARAETRQRDAQIAALERQAEAVAAVVARIEPIRRDIHAAPRTSACVASPVIARGFERLRATRPAAGGAALPAGVQGGAGGP